VIATEAGLTRPGPGRWERNGKPEHLKAQAEKSLRLLGLERIELFQLHRIDPEVPLADQLGALVELQAEGKIGRIGLSEVSVPEVQAARAITPIATVQNLYNLSDRSAEPVLDYCEREDIGFIPWSRWLPVTWPDPTARCNGSQTSRPSHLRSSRSRGCCSAHPFCCRSPALPRSHTSKRTWVRP